MLFLSIVVMSLPLEFGGVLRIQLYTLCVIISHLNFIFISQVHLSFSQLGGAAEGGNKTCTHIGGSFLSLLLQSVGVAVTEVQDVEFK